MWEDVKRTRTSEGQEGEAGYRAGAEAAEEPLLRQPRIFSRVARRVAYGHLHNRPQMVESLFLIRPPSSSRVAPPKSAAINGALPGAYIGPMVGRWRMTSARWPGL